MRGRVRRLGTEGPGKWKVRILSRHWQRLGVHGCSTSGRDAPAGTISIGIKFSDDVSSSPRVPLSKYDKTAQRLARDSLLKI